MGHQQIRGALLAVSACVGLSGLNPALAAAMPAGASSAAAVPWAGKGGADPTFTPDGDMVVFVHGKGTARALYVSHRQAGRWSKPERAPFSRHWMNFEPVMAPDGSYLVFVSNRPVKRHGQVLDGYFGGKVQPGRGGNLWRVDFVHGRWGEPMHLPDVVNVSTATYSPTVAADGSIYFTHPDPRTHRTRMYVARRVDGKFRLPHPVSFSNGVQSDFDPAVAPDQSFIVFSSDRPPTPRNQNEVFVAFATAQGWSTPVPLGIYGYEARLGPDQRVLYYIAGADDRIHRFPIAGWLTRHAADGRR
ncbi:MAG TPA: hypothetical protein VFW60_04185 [Rhodanobacteraceae bacterium]|nr:hypothetical protein [Rhodanobacteraceae bacterium]